MQPQALMNTLARLGWSKGDDDVFYLQDLIENFSLNEIQKAGAIFDITKLDWLNSQHLAKLSLEEFKSNLEPFLKLISIDIHSHNNVDLLIESMRTSDNTLKAIAESLTPYYSKDINYDEKAINKFLGEEGQAILFEIKVLLTNVEEWNENEIDLVLKNFQETNKYSIPQVNQPIRIALTGSTKSPSIGLTLKIFEKNESLKRIDAILHYLNS